MTSQSDAIPAQETVTAYIYSYIQRFRGRGMNYQGNFDKGCEQLSIDSAMKDIDTKGQDAGSLPKFINSGHGK